MPPYSKKPKTDGAEEQTKPGKGDEKIKKTKSKEKDSKKDKDNKKKTKVKKDQIKKKEKKENHKSTVMKDGDSTPVEAPTYPQLQDIGDETPPLGQPLGQPLGLTEAEEAVNGTRRGPHACAHDWHTKPDTKMRVLHVFDFDAEKMKLKRTISASTSHGRKLEAFSIDWQLDSIPWTGTRERFSKMALSQQQI